MPRSMTLHMYGKHKQVGVIMHMPPPYLMHNDASKRLRHPLSLHTQCFMNRSHSARIDPNCRDREFVSQMLDGNGGNNGGPFQ
jgi:hypothetical protein